MVTKATNLGAREALQKNVADVVAPTLPDLFRQIDGMKTEPKGLTFSTPPDDADRPGPDVGLEAAARPADRPEHHRADALDRPDRDRRRALEPRPHLPRHRRGDLADRRPLRAPGAADLGGRAPADAARGGLLRRRGVHRLARRTRARGLDHVRDRSADALRSGRRRVPGLDAGRGRDRRHARAPLRPRPHEGGAGPALAGRRSARTGSSASPRRRASGNLVFVDGELWHARSADGAPLEPGRRCRSRASSRTRSSSS